VLCQIVSVLFSTHGLRIFQKQAVYCVVGGGFVKASQIQKKFDLKGVG